MLQLQYLTLCIASILLVRAACAQSQPNEDPPLQVAAALQSNYASNPAAGSSLGFIENQFSLTEATVNLTGQWTHLGYELDTGYGDYYKLAAAQDSWKGPNEYISQAYITIKNPGDLPVQLDAGKFFSSVGAESAQGFLDQDFNTTRSLLFWYGSPLYHVGVRASATVTSSVTLGAQLLSGSNTVTGAHGHQTMVLTVNRTGKRWTLTQLYLGGNQKLAGSGWRQLSDTVLTLAPRENIRAYIELLGAIEKRAEPGHARWFGWATSWRFAMGRKWAVSPRAEWYNDPDGFTTGVGQRLEELTITGEYRPAKAVIARLEYRTDWSSHPGSPRRDAVIAGITLLFHHAL